jgi:hypothetical protein
MPSFEWEIIFECREETRKVEQERIEALAEAVIYRWMALAAMDLLHQRTKECDALRERLKAYMGIEDHDDRQSE